MDRIKEIEMDLVRLKKEKEDLRFQQKREKSQKLLTGLKASIGQSIQVEGYFAESDTSGATDFVRKISNSPGAEFEGCYFDKGVIKDAHLVIKGCDFTAEIKMTLTMELVGIEILEDE
jgi:hypothetical protein